MISGLYLYIKFMVCVYSALHSSQWRYNERDDLSIHLRLDCLLNRLFRCISKKIPKLRVPGLWEVNLPVTGEFPAQRASNAEMFPFDDVSMISNLNGLLDRFTIFMSNTVLYKI